MRWRWCRLFEYPPGSILGQKDFLMGTPRTATATCGQACELHVVPRAAFDTLRQRSPEVPLPPPAATADSCCPGAGPESPAWDACSTRNGARCSK